MIIDKKFIELFESFCKSSGGSEFIRPLASSQPDIRFEWFGYQYWAFQSHSGFEFFGENMPILEKEWSGFLEYLENEQESEE